MSRGGDENYQEGFSQLYANDFPRDSVLASRTL